MSDEPSAFSAFAGVDQMPEPALLVRAMDETSEWAATKTLRGHADSWLAPRAGASILDVGCGPGTAALALAAQVAPDGRVQGIDASSVMVEEANRRAEAAGVPAGFAIGDAAKLEFDDATFDGCRSERTFQWLEDAAVALAELVRVTKPGGTIVVIDTDWGTFGPDHPDPLTTQRIMSTMTRTRPGFLVGRRLRGMFLDAGLEDVRVESATHLVTSWDPSARPSPPGLPPLTMLVNALTAEGSMSEAEAGAWLAQLEEHASRDRYFSSLTMFAVAGRKPS